MYVRSPISASCITAGKLYRADKISANLATITDDDGDRIIIRLSSCSFLNNMAWEILPADQLTKEKETSMTDKRTSEEIAYDAALESLNLKEGDIVTVTGGWPSHHLGWSNLWVEEMDDFLGERCIVGEIPSARKGIKLFWDGDCFCFPPYVLKKLEDAPKKPEPAPEPEPELMASDATLRDYFAVQALTELAYDYSNPEEVATHCYTLADAMMAEKEKRRKKA